MEVLLSRLVYSRLCIVRPRPPHNRRRAWCKTVSITPTTMPDTNTMRAPRRRQSIWHCYQSCRDFLPSARGRGGGVNGAQLSTMHCFHTFGPLTVSCTPPPKRSKKKKETLVCTAKILKSSLCLCPLIFVHWSPRIYYIYLRTLGFTVPANFQTLLVEATTFVHL